MGTKFKLAILHALTVTHLLGVVRFVRQRLFVFKVRIRYAKILKRLKDYPRGRPVRVLFLSEYSEKWKTQSLYVALNEAADFEPYIALTIDVDEWRINPSKAKERLLRDEQFYVNLGCKCLRAFDLDNGEAIPLERFNPDVVFFQEPGIVYAGQIVRDVSKYALCCYVPYSIETFKLLPSHRTPYFHELLFLQVAVNRMDELYIKRFMPWWRRSGTIQGFGHTIFDEYPSDCSETSRLHEGYIIYAPHFSFPSKDRKRNITISTFLETGDAILRYAQTHADKKWLFKPHPRLRRELEELGVWTADKINAYYTAWEKIGASYYTGDYVRLFIESDCLITDCSSFLVEYPLTGRPVIRLVQDKTNVETRPAYKELFSTFYNVHNLEELYSAMDMIVKDGRDPLRARRVQKIAYLGLLTGGIATRNIINYLRKKCFR